MSNLLHTPKLRAMVEQYLDCAGSVRYRQVYSWVKK